MKMIAKSIWTRTLAVTIILAMIVAFMPVITNGGDVHAASKKKVKVTFKANGGKIGTKTSKVKNVTKGKKVGKLPKATQKGYTFKGWYTKKSGGKKITKNTKVKKKTTYYAQWKAKEYTVNFDANGGETPSFKSKKVKYNSKYGTMPTTKRSGYKFKGWYTAKTGGTSVTANTTNTTAATDTLYGQWEATEEETYSLTVTGDLITGGLYPEFTITGQGNYKPGTKVWIDVTPVNFNSSALSFEWTAYCLDPFRQLSDSDLGSGYISNFGPGESTGIYIIMPNYDTHIIGSFY